MSLGETIRQARVNKGLSLRETARRAEMSNSYLSQLENGHNTNPDGSIIRKLSDVLDVPWVSLLSELDYVKEAIQENVDDKINTYKEVRDIAGLTMYEEYTFELEELFSERTKLTNGGKLLTEVDKKKIVTLIDTILN